TPAKNVSRGISFLAQANRVFDELSVMENLKIGAYKMPHFEASQRIEHVLELFPELRSRLNDNSGKLSGGQQQQLALSRALIQKPKLLLLDEPSLGLSPKLIKQIFGKIVEVNKELNISVLIVEQKVKEVLKICDKVYSLKHGKVAFGGNSTALINNGSKLKELFL
ncbi:MAG: ATP-binding cassette domain-containing protein, partial [Candidatus Zixiibacteriota bacterium]